MNLATVAALSLAGVEIVPPIIAEAASCAAAIELFLGVVGSAVGLGGSGVPKSHSIVLNCCD